MLEAAYSRPLFTTCANTAATEDYSWNKCANIETERPAAAPLHTVAPINFDSCSFDKWSIRAHGAPAIERVSHHELVAAEAVESCETEQANLHEGEREAADLR